MLAYPVASASEPVRPRITLGTGDPVDVAVLHDGDLQSAIEIACGTTDSPGMLMLSYETPQTVRSATMFALGKTLFSDFGGLPRCFQAGRGAPASVALASLASLSENSDPGIKYFSGVATYTQQFKLPRGVPSGGTLLLDLGKAGDIAEVRINGQLLGTLWHAPYRIDIGKTARKGSNELEIRVANLWVNRLIGDAQQGATKVAYTAGPAYRADAPLRPAGLIGPVQLLAVQPSTITHSRHSAGK